MANNKEELIAEIQAAKEVTKDYSKFKHLFSEDEGIKTLAKLNQTLSQIEYHLKLSGIKEIIHPQSNALKNPLFGTKGALVKVRPCGEKYQNKTYLGFLIGELALGSTIKITDEKIECSWSGYNPAIFVPEFGEIIFGMESWWSEIESEADLKDITMSDIENVWYVKALKERLSKKEENKEEEL